MIAGGALVLCAALLFFYNQWDDARAGQASADAANTLLSEIQSNSADPITLEVQGDEEDTSQHIQAVELDGAYYMGIITIPALDRSLPVQSDWSNDKLRTSPCRYSGSLEDGQLVLAGHNYTRHFGGIHRLSVGSEIIFTDLEGNEYHYAVEEISTLAADDIEGMTQSGYDLTLFTCNYGGQSRLTVRCSLTGWSAAEGGDSP